MPKTDDSELEPNLERQLRSALDRVQPRFSSPRYAGHRSTPWRVAPIALAAGVTGVAVLSLSAAAGSLNPAVVVNRISTAIQPAAETTPTPAPVPEESPKPAPPVHQAEPAPEPTERPEPKPAPEPTEGPEPGQTTPPESGDEHDGSWSSPSPSPGWDH